MTYCRVLRLIPVWTGRWLVVSTYTTAADRSAWLESRCVVSSVESGLSESQCSDRPVHQAKANSALGECECDGAGRDVDTNWWGAPVPNRLTAAYQGGRLLNQLSWHFQQVLFGFHEDKSSVDQVLDRLEGITYRLVDEPPNYLSAVINDVRRRYERQLCGSAASENVAAALIGRKVDNENLSDEDPRQELVEIWLNPLLEPVRQCIWEKLAVTERWALELGECLDEGIRPSGLYRSIEGRRYIRRGYYDSELNTSGPYCRESGIEIRSFQPGELVNSAAWPYVLRPRLAKVGVPAASFETILLEWEQAEAHEQQISLPQLLEHLDRCIRGHVDAPSATVRSENGSLDPTPEIEGSDDAYVSFITLWPDQFPTYKQAKGFLDRTKSIRRRSPSKNRLEVHAADWINHFRQRENLAFDSMDVTPEEVKQVIDSAAKRKLRLDSNRDQQKRG